MNNEKILAQVRMFVLREKLLCPGEPLHLAAAVSGGADSMALLRILLALQPEFGFEMCIRDSCGIVSTLDDHCYLL